MNGVSAYPLALGLITAALCFLQAACTSSSAYRLDEGDSLPSKVGSVSVEVSTDIPSDRASRLREVSGIGLASPRIRSSRWVRD
jgi:hypothetical protein